MWRQRLVKVVLLAAVLGVCFLFALGILAQSYLTRDLLEREIEKSINSEVHIGEVDISFFSLPSRIVIRDVTLRHKDSKPGSEAPITIREASLAVNLMALLRRHIHVTGITISEAAITNTYYKNGDTALQRLFESPDEEKRKRRDKKRREGKKGGGFNIHDQKDFATTLDRLVIEDSSLELVLEGMGLNLLCQDLDVELSSITIDPEDLVTTNNARLNIGSRIRIDSSKGKQYADILLNGDATVRLFNPETGDAEPEVSGELHLDDSSWLNAQLPFITRAWNSLAVLGKLGLQIGELPEKATFGRSQSISAHYHQGQVSVQQPLSIWLQDWEIAVLEGGWLNAQNDQHEVRGELLASRKASGFLKPLVFKGVALLPAEIRDQVSLDLEGNLFRDDRLLVKIKSSGDFSDPKVRVDGEIVEISKAAKEAAREMLQQKAGDVLKGLLK